MRDRYRILRRISRNDRHAAGAHNAFDRACHGVYKDKIDYSVFAGEWEIGRIYERKGFPDDVRFFWSLHGVVLTRAPDIHTSGHERFARNGEGAVQVELGALAGVVGAGTG
jgi:hypothetical protein